ncbi:putative ribonuclease H-like domain-containing protein [Tanacetum coccineum]
MKSGTAMERKMEPIIEDWVSDSDEENVPKVKIVKMFNKPSFAKINFVKSTEQRSAISYSNKTDDKELKEYGFVSTTLKQGTSHKDLQNCLFACFLSQEEPKKIVQALKDPRTKWVFRNKKDERGIVIKNKARLVAQGYIQEEGIDYDEEVYVCQKPGFEDPDFSDIVYKVEKALYGLHQAPRAWYETLSTYLLDNGFQRGKIDKTLFIRRIKSDILLVQMSSMGELTFFLGLQVKQKNDGIFISQDKYVTKILKRFGFSDVKAASTPMETHKPLLKYADVCVCARFQVNPKVSQVSHLHAVKRIFRYLKGQPKLGLWYPKYIPFDLVAYTDSDYARASLDRKFTTGGCQFLGCRLISWQCKKQTMVANSTTKAEYVAASNANEKKLIQMIKIHTDKNVADLLTKAFDEDASKQGRKIHDIDADEDITLENVHDAKMFDVNDLYGDVVVVESEVVAKKKDDEVNVVEEVVSVAKETVNAATITEDEITLAQALAELKSVKPKVTTATTATTKGILLQEPSESITTTTTTTITIPSKDKGKGIMVKQSLQMKKKDQITFDEQEAIGLQVEFDEEVRLEREKDKANVALIKEWNDIQAKIETDYELAQRLQAEEQE